ncbi:hypothetical protein M422DRAFT_776736 [Sphaerobolus stellatus SS14]|nr:hypothetical protein M422DRAFT_776736 [Sphaerobolus stellatus SS14]
MNVEASASKEEYIRCDLCRKKFLGDPGALQRLQSHRGLSNCRQRQAKRSQEANGNADAPTAVSTVTNLTEDPPASQSPPTTKGKEKPKYIYPPVRNEKKQWLRKCDLCEQMVKLDSSFNGGHFEQHRNKGPCRKQQRKLGKVPEQNLTNALPTSPEVVESRSSSPKDTAKVLKRLPSAKDLGSSQEVAERKMHLFNSIPGSSRPTENGAQPSSNTAGSSSIHPPTHLIEDVDMDGPPLPGSSWKIEEERAVVPSAILKMQSDSVVASSSTSKDVIMDTPTRRGQIKPSDADLSTLARDVRRALGVSANTKRKPKEVDGAEEKGKKKKKKKKKSAVTPMIDIVNMYHGTGMYG